MQVRFHPEALSDLRNAADAYAAERMSLAQEFYQHTDRLVAEIGSNPMLFRVYRAPKARRHFRRPFPYAVVYAILPDYVWVLAVMHFKQHPDYWSERLG